MRFICLDGAHSYGECEIIMIMPNLDIVETVNDPKLAVFMVKSSQPENKWNVCA